MCTRSPGRGATSRPSCRTSRAPWRARLAVRSRTSPPRPRATPSPSSDSMNLAHLLLRTARSRPEVPALAVGRKVVSTYGELAARVSRLSFSLRSKLNLSPGDRVALAMKNCPQYHEVLFACWHAGLVAVPMNAKLHAKEFAYIVENSGAKACFVTSDLETAIPTGTPLSELPKLRGAPVPIAERKADDAAWLFYTSGTTGVP